MIKSLILMVHLIVTGEPGDTVVCRKTLDSDVLASVMVMLGPYQHSEKVEFFVLPEEAGRVAFDCRRLLR